MYIVFDLEWNNLFYEPRRSANKSDIDFAGSGFDEIIEIGAYKLDKNFNVVDTFNSLVKPVVYRKMAHVVRRMTGITYDQLEEERSYEAVINEFIKFLGRDYTLVTFSDTDIRVLFINNMFFGVDNKRIKYNKYIDIQEVFVKSTGLNHNVSLSKSGRMLGFDVDEDHMHTALDDASLTVDVMRELSKTVKLSKMVKNANEEVHLPKFFGVDLLKVDKKLLKSSCLKCGKKNLKHSRNYNTSKNKVVLKTYCKNCNILSVKSITVKKSISGKNKFFVKESMLDRNKSL